MKPKILLVKYADWVVIGLLSILLIYALLKAFVLTDTTAQELAREIAKYDQAIREAINRQGPPSPLVPPNLIEEFRRRLERPPVISSFARNPFRPEEDVVARAPILLKKGQSTELVFEGVHFIEVIEADPKIVKTAIDYNPDESVSYLTVEGLEEGNATVRIATLQDQVYRLTVVVQEKPTYASPNPPAQVRIVAQGRYETEDIKRPARVLISFRANNPQTPTAEVGMTTGAYIYRKPADAPDTDYVRLNAEPLSPAPREKIDQIWDWFFPQPKRLARLEEAGYGPEGRGLGAQPYGPGYQPGPPGYGPGGLGPGGVPGGPGMGRPGEIAVPPTAEELGPPTRPGVPGMRRPPAGSYIFVDQTVDEGESYVYKIVTISAMPGAEPVECDRPYVTRRPVAVPSFVTLMVASASYMRGSVYLSRPDPETGRPLIERFSLVPGMLIGGPKRMRRQQTVEFPPGPAYKFVDFSTGAVLVDSLPFIRRIDYRVRWDRRKNEFVYDVRQASDPRILYLTPRGSLRWKGKEEERRITAAPGAAGPLAAPGRRPAY